MLNIHDNHCPRVVEPLGDGKKMVVTYSTQVNVAHVDGEPSTLNRMLALARP